MVTYDSEKMLPWLVLLALAAVYGYIVISSAMILSLLGGALGGVLAFGVLLGGLALGWVGFDRAREHVAATAG